MTTTESARVSPASRPADVRRAAIWAGLAVVLMAPLGMLGNVLVLGLEGDITAVGAAVAADPGLVNVAAVAFIAVAILDVIAAWGIARFFADGTGASELAGWLRAVYAAGLMVGAGLLVLATTVASDADAALTGLGVVAFRAVWQLSLVVFAAHLAVLAFLVVRHAAAPSVVGWIVAIASAGYAFDGIARLSLPSDALALTIGLIVVSAASIAGELALAVWLLARGGRARKETAR